MNPEGGPKAIEDRDPMESQEYSDSPTAELLATFDSLHTHVRSHTHNEQEREEAFGQLHSVAEQFENKAMLNAYEQGNIPSFESMNRAVDRIVEEVEKESNGDFSDEEKVAIQRIKGRVREIRSWCSRYVESLVTYHRKSKRMRETGGNEGAGARDEYVKADTDRRRIHENLLTSIRQLDESIKTIDDLFGSQIIRIQRWDPVNPTPTGYALENPLVFSGKAGTHSYRNLVRDWAIVANLEHKMNLIRQADEPKNE